MDPRFKAPFTCVVAGPTGSGKTFFVRRFLEQRTDVISPSPDKIVWCYGEWQDDYATMRDVELREGLPDLNELPRRTLVVIDDLMAETDDRVTKLFTKGSHHRDVSVVYIVQDLFSKNKEHRSISLNAHYLVIFKSPRDASQITHLAKQMYPGNIKYLQETFQDATSSPHGYLLVDLKQQTPEHMRLRSHIFPGEIQCVYLRK
jgi:hypothetical protein